MTFLDADALPGLLLSVPTMPGISASGVFCMLWVIRVVHLNKDVISTSPALPSQKAGQKCRGGLHFLLCAGGGAFPPVFPQVLRQNSRGAVIKDLCTSSEIGFLK